MRFGKIWAITVVRVSVCRHILIRDYTTSLPALLRSSRTYMLDFAAANALFLVTSSHRHATVTDMLRRNQIQQLKDADMQRVLELIVH